MALELNTNQTTWAEAANEISKKALDKTGDIMEGALILSQSPVDDDEATRKDYVDNYQKPWNIAANVEKINLSEGSMGTNHCKSTTDFSSMSYSIIMKNSGVLYIDVKTGTYDSSSSYRPKNICLEFYINDDLINMVSIDDPNNNTRQKITVNKGDIVKVLEKHTASYDGKSASVYAKINLFANFETPYIYLNTLGVSKQEQKA